MDNLIKALHIINKNIYESEKLYLKLRKIKCNCDYHNNNNNIYEDMRYCIITKEIDKTKRFLKYCRKQIIKQINIEKYKNNEL